jgi:integrase
MLLVMIVTGARPSTIRPLRRSPPQADYDRTTGRLLLRRSQVVGAPMDETKTGLDQSLPLPPSVQQVLNDHIDRLDASTGPMGHSPLLFPNIKGGFRARSVLDKPMAEVCEALKLPRVTAKGLRRTFKDVARTLSMDRLVEKSISGHMSDKMDFVYGTALSSEKREALDSVVRAIGLAASNEQRKPADE